jgi:hypothetical protein
MVVVSVGGAIEPPVDAAAAAARTATTSATVATRGAAKAGVVSDVVIAKASEAMVVESVGGAIEPPVDAAAAVDIDNAIAITGATTVTDAAEVTDVMDAANTTDGWRHCGLRMGDFRLKLPRTGLSTVRTTAIANAPPMSATATSRAAVEATPKAASVALVSTSRSMEGRGVTIAGSADPVADPTVATSIAAAPASDVVVDAVAAASASSDAVAAVADAPASEVVDAAAAPASASAPAFVSDVAVAAAPVAAARRASLLPLPLFVGMKLLDEVVDFTLPPSLLLLAQRREQLQVCSLTSFIHIYAMSVCLSVCYICMLCMLDMSVCMLCLYAVSVCYVCMLCLYAMSVCLYVHTPV